MKNGFRRHASFPLGWVLGSDWPFVPWHPSPVAWVESLATITAEEKERILWQNVEALLGL